MNPHRFYIFEEGKSRPDKKYFCLDTFVTKVLSIFIVHFFKFRLLYSATIATICMANFQFPYFRSNAFSLKVVLTENVFLFMTKYGLEKIRKTTIEID